MNRDTIVFVAFCLFIVVVGMRIWGQRKERKKIKLTEPESGKQIRREAAGGKKNVEEERKNNGKRSRRWYFMILQLLVLGGLAIYMIGRLIHDFTIIEELPGKDVILRCLIFILTIYVFISVYVKAFGCKNRGKS